MQRYTQSMNLCNAFLFNNLRSTRIKHDLKPEPRSTELQAPLVKSLEKQRVILQSARDGLQLAFDSGEDHLGRLCRKPLVPYTTEHEMIYHHSNLEIVNNQVHSKLR